MKWVVKQCSAALGLCLLVNLATAEDWHPRSPLPPLPPSSGSCCQPPPGCATPGGPGMPGDPNKPNDPGMGQPGDQGNQPGQQGQDSQSPEAGSLVANTFDTGLFGDLIGPVGQRIVTPTGVTPIPRPRSIATIAPVPYRGTFKITENESPRPTDRVFFGYNFFDNVSKNFSGLPSGQANLNRETIGFEKTFLDGDASAGMRLPFFQLTGNSAVESSQVGDLSILFKYAFINNHQNGNVLSTGMVVTVPTGPGVPIDGESELHSTIFEPWVGYIYHFDQDLFIEGFSSVSVPTDSRDVTLLFNSIAAGYWLYRDNDRNAILCGIVPDLEFHLNTPLNHRGLDSSGPIGYSDTLDTTAGCYFIFKRATVGAAICVPLTGPKPYDFEATATLSLHF